MVRLLDAVGEDGAVANPLKSLDMRSARAEVVRMKRRETAEQEVALTVSSAPTGSSFLVAASGDPGEHGGHHLESSPSPAAAHVGSVISPPLTPRTRGRATSTLRPHSTTL